MPEPPEILFQTATPATILDRLDLMCDQYRMGVMDAESFNEALKLFQFRDDGGVLWTPGAQTSRWYRWDGRRWVPGSPPERLQIPPMPLSLGIGEDPPMPGYGVVRYEAAPPLPQCPKCGAPDRGTKFCTSCGTKLS
ncbi:zinc ribbon domain-containing protein [Crenobacter cavernae]|uniref:Zinc ribbon domain-containing protein n=1 Tax=Crenobacter cavernae TaxID=2290923 RepID=A0ABY0F986_9NEIS|nr:zinc ribbon domain-containing protein [Crenobacter cavernae]RXZ42044.1 zinc ribbon domain-containing protein [Crenobacter cavernae]